MARAAGADEVILYRQQDFVATLRDYTAGAGAHVVYDSVGQATFAGSLEVLRPCGYLVSFGQSSGPVPAQGELGLSSRLQSGTISDVMKQAGPGQEQRLG